MKFGDHLQGRINDIDEKGRGTFTYPLPHDPKETRRVAVPFTAPGDEIRATFAKRDQGTWIGRLEEVITPSADRLTPPCPHAGVCGGCLWQHLAYPAQLHLKQKQINLALERAGHDVRVTTVIPSPDTLFYRNRMDYVVGWQGTLGLKEYGSWNRYLDLKTCLLLDQDTPTMLNKVREWMKKHDLEPWDARKQRGLVRYAVIRLGRNTQERMVTIIVKDLSSITDAAQSDMKDQLAPFTTTLYLGENPDRTDLSYAKTLRLLYGHEYLSEEVNGLRYLIHPNSFFQTNTVMAGQLQNKVLEYVGKPRSILDLYCGSGFFGLACAKRGMHVYGHELDAAAIELAKQNSVINTVDQHIEFGAGPVEDLDWETRNPDAVIIDPPRAGLHPRALKTLLDKQPNTLVYVSCNYHRLVDELKTLQQVYTVERIEALDLFPHTPHVEVVTKLIKK